MGDCKVTLPDGYVYVNIAEDALYRSFRCNLSSSQEWRDWVTLFEASACQKFIVKRTRNTVSRYAFGQDLVCQHSKVNKSVSTDSVQHHSRSTGCKASISVKIKLVNKNTRRHDSFLKQDPPLPATVTLSLEHNHQTECADALRQLRVSDETRHRFMEYFNDGLSPATAMSLHESKILSEENPVNQLANAAVNPTSRSVYYLHSIWLQENFGSATDPLVKLAETVDYYYNLGTSISISTEKPWCVLVVTDMMKRTHSLAVADEMVFIDSSSSCDATSSTVTTVLVSSKAGALPVAIMLHEGQSAVSYRVAFGMLRLHYPECFNGNESPMAVMTDDSAAMKTALRTVWLSARQLLCHFHVAQAEWRWLTAKVNQIPDDERQSLMKAFQKIMYATSNDDLETAKDEFNSATDDEDYESLCPTVRYKKRVAKFLERGDEWLSVQRGDVLTRGSNTNNFSEATMRILKDIILSRTKAFNVVALVDFCTTVLQNYFVKRLLNFAHGRRANPRLKYSQLCDQMRNVDSDTVTVIDQFRFHVPSQTSTNIMYSVDAEFGLCACRSGMNGVFCKHQALVHERFHVPFQNAPAVTSQDRYCLAQLALGEKCPSIDFFTSFRDACTLQVDEPTLLQPNASEVAASNLSASTAISEDFDTIDNAADDVRSLKESAKLELSRIALLVTPYSSSAVSALLTCLQGIKTEEDLIQAAYHCRSAMRARRGGIIKVQPTSVARRRVGLTRGSKRAASGRPPLNSGSGVQHPSKRPRLLAANVKANVPHSKSHGVGH